MEIKETKYQNSTECTLIIKGIPKGQTTTNI